MIIFPSLNSEEGAGGDIAAHCTKYMSWRHGDACAKTDPLNNGFRYIVVQWDGGEIDYLANNFTIDRSGGLVPFLLTLRSTSP